MAESAGHSGGNRDQPLDSDNGSVGLQEFTKKCRFNIAVGDTFATLAVTVGPESLNGPYNTVITSVFAI